MQHDKNLHEWTKEVSWPFGLSNALGTVTNVSLTLGVIDSDESLDNDQALAERVQALKAKRNTVAAQQDRKRQQRAARFERRR